MHCNKCKALITPLYDDECVPTTHQEWWTAITGNVTTCNSCWYGWNGDDSDTVSGLDSNHPMYHR